MEMVQDFARNVIGDTKAMATIADLINGREDIQAALCQEIGDRIFAEMEKIPNWSVSGSKYPEGQEIRIESGNDRWDYAVWTEGKDLRHGFVENGGPFTGAGRTDFAKRPPGDPQEYAGNYFCIASTVDLSDRALAERFTEAGIRRSVSEVEAAIK